MLRVESLSDCKFCMKWCPCAFRLRRLAQSDPDEIIKKVLWRSWWGPLLRTGPSDKMLCRSCWNPLRGPSLILYTSLREDLVKVLLKSSERSEVLAWSCTEPLRRSCAGPGEVLSKRSLHDLVHPCAKILWRPWWNPPPGLVWSCTDPYEEIFGNPSEVLSTSSLHDLVQVLARRSC